MREVVIQELACIIGPNRGDPSTARTGELASGDHARAVGREQNIRLKVYRRVTPQPQAAQIDPLWESLQLCRIAHTGCRNQSAIRRQGESAWPGVSDLPEQRVIRDAPEGDIAIAKWIQANGEDFVVRCERQ